MTAFNLFIAVTLGNIVSVVLATSANTILDRYYNRKRRAKLDAMIRDMAKSEDFNFALAPKKTVKKTVKKQAPKKNG